MYNNNMYRNFGNYQNNRGIFAPLIVGGIIGYGLGSNNNNRPNCCPVFFPQPFFYNPFFPPFFR